jgi:hypothetical protein
MRELAQTNLQLYEQLVALEWSQEQLADVRHAYDLACQLFSGRYRASGKTFVAHVVGTASCVAAVREPPNLVSAALLHAAYTAGDFGSGRRAPSPRARVVAIVGSEVEALVAEYATMPWSVEEITGLRDHAATLPPVTRGVAVIHLANEVDERVDGGARIADRGDYELYRDEAARAMAELAVALGHVDFVALMEEVGWPFASVPAALRCDLPASVLRPPESYRRRRTVRSILSGIRRRISP